MRKVNKTMMKTVAILLSLVLITSSIISGTLAKFVTIGSASAAVSFKRFGVGTSVTLDSDFEAAVGSENIERIVNGDCVTINCSNLKIAPGDDFLDAFKFDFSGVSDTRLLVTMEFDVNFDNTQFTIPAESAGNTKDIGYFPLNIYAWSNDSDETAIYDEQKTALGELYFDWQYNNNFFPDELATWLGMELTGTYYENAYVAKIFEPGEEIVFGTDDNNPIKEFYFGWEWPFGTEDSVASEYDKYDTWLIDNKTPSMSVSIIIRMEQISDTYVIEDYKLTSQS
ncbi:MAG: hypothetical protein E7678_02550 [Ruminococcaceae bacterium]|nr:hypothetical protein [Oscillospiraceae bacterium]